MVASQAAVQVLGLVTSVVVARLLSPREVGLAAEALVFAALALVFVDFGFGAALIHKPDLTQEDLSTAFWAGTALGVAMALAGVGLSWPIAELYGEPAVQGLFAAMSLAFLLTAPGIVQGALLMRELKFRALELRTVAASGASGAATVLAAALGAGPWAFVVQMLTIVGVSTALLWRSSSWRPTATFSRASLRSMSSYASHVFGAQALDWAVKNTDNLLVGRFLGASAVGAYSIAFNVIVTPLKRLALPLTNVFFPAFSEMREPERISGVWLRAVRMMALLVVPAMAGLVVLADDFVRVVFGSQWDAAVPVLQILAPVGLVQALQALNIGVLQALARTRELFRYTLVASVVTVAAFAAGLPWELEGVATAYLLATCAVVPAFLRLTTRAVGLRPRDWLRAVRGVGEASLGMLVVLIGCRELLLESSLPAGARLAACVAVGGAVYLPLVAWRAPEVRAEIRELLARRRAGAPHQSALARR